ncbi:MAG: enoyl-CoA hydratase [Solirubrobacterales bacterium]|nr:enoyl-CoA hydratase [Solirubrobacterales bacterium]
MQDTVLVDDADGVRVVTINRPDVRNAVDLQTARAISDALDELEQRDDLRVGVITGSGGTFCAGMDLKALAATGERPIVKPRGAFGIVEQPPAKPVLAAVEGYALGGGFEVALACDLIVAAEDATFGLPEVKRGQVAAAGGVMRLQRRMPHHVAMEVVLTGDPLTARRAHALGLVNHLAAPGGALRAATEIAARIAANGPLAVAVSKRVMVESPAWPINEAFERQEPLVNVVRASEDAREGARAFVEKRPPVWSGR